MLPRFFSEVFNGVWAIHKPSADGYMPLLLSILKGEFQKNDSLVNGTGLKSGIRFYNMDDTPSYYDENQKSDIQNTNQDVIAMLYIIGPIVKYDMACGPDGTSTLEKLLDEADANPYVKGHFIVIDSPGGEGYASISLAEKIRSLKKPSIGFISDMAASGGCCIITACNYVVANRNIARVGSIGTYSTYINYAKWFEMNGYFVKDIYATKSTKKNIESREAEKGNFKPLTIAIDRFNEEFLATIKLNRGSKLGDESIWSNGNLFFADESFAESTGLIDDIASFEETFQSFVKSINQ
jgi:ClpP class serine protease